MFDYSYLILIVVTLVIGLAASGYVNRQLKKYAKVPISSGMTGAEAAHRMLSYYGINDVTVTQGGAGQDFYDPRKKIISLGPEVYSGRTITATATAYHEAGHACQHADGYVPIKIRGTLVPVVNLASNAWIFFLIAGIAMQGASPIAGNLIWVAIILYAFAVLFQIVTLPVEFNASKRAMVYMETSGMLQSEQGGSFSVLRACALTYVAAALTSIMQLLWLLGRRE